MKKSGMEIEKYVERGMLNVIAKESVFTLLGETKHERTGQDLVSIFSSIIAGMKQKSGKSGNAEFKGISVMFSADTSFELGDFDKHMEFETMIGERVASENVELVCFYKLESLSKLGLGALIRILNYHDYTVHGGWNYRGWVASDTTELIREGMAAALNGEMSELLLRTLNLVHKMDNNKIISQPEVFEANLIKALGQKKAEMVVSSIKEKIRKELSFG